MSTSGLQKRYTSAMEKIIKNAVSETSKVLETIIVELKAEVRRVKSENENLTIRCNQFEEVVKKRSVYRETGTSPEPYIIERCDKAVQCDLGFQQPEELNPNLSDNETQSERSFGPIHEKESSNDSFSFIQINEDERNTYEPLDLSNITSPEKSCDQETNTSDDRPEQIMESDSYLETLTHSFGQEQEIVTTISSPQVELYEEEHESCCETSEIEIQEVFQEDVGIKCAKTNDSLLECQEELKERITMQEDVKISVEKEVEICKKSKPEECINRLFPDLSKENAQQQVVQETTEMNVELDPQSKPSSEIDNASSAETTNTELANNLVQADNSNVSSVQDQAISPLNVIPTVIGPEIESTAVQSLPAEDLPAKKAQKAPPTLKYPYFLRRQRCTSVTLEDAMLLLDAVNLHEYKSSTLKKAQTKHSLRPFGTSKISNKPEVSQKILAEDSLNSEEHASTAETLEQPAPHTAEVIEEACPSNLGKEDQGHHRETIPHTKPSLEAVIDHGVLMVTPTKLTLVTEADSVSMDIEDGHHEILSSPTKLSSTRAVDNDTANMCIEAQEDDQITTTSPAKPLAIEPAQNVNLELQIMMKQDEVFQEVEVIECPAEKDIDHDHENHDYRSWSLIPPTRTASVAPGADDPAEQTEPGQATIDPETQNCVVNFTPPTVALPSESLTRTESDLAQAKPDETESGAQISDLPAPHTESQENDVAISLALSPPKPPHNPITQHTLLLKMPGETGNLSSSVVKTITSSSALSPAQLSAVVSAVRSTQSTVSSTGSSQSAPSGKKLVAVPFSLQSVMKPHHKIIVIPRQCKLPPSQAITKDKAIVLKKNPFQLDATTTVISTSDVNLDPCFGINNATQELDMQHLALESSQTSPAQEKSPCKNKVQVSLNRLPFPVVSTQTLSFTNTSPDGSLTTPNNPSRPPMKAVLSQTATKLPEAQPVEETLTSLVFDISPKSSNKRNKAVKTSSSGRGKSTSRSANIVRLSPVMSNDHSYPQHRMTKSQFLAKLEVSPVTQDSEKAGSSRKDVQKASLVDRLRSHLKKVQDSTHLTIEATDRTSVTQESVTSGPAQEQQSEILGLPDTVPHVDENKSASSIKTSPVTKSVTSVKQVKRKNCPKIDKIIPTKPVKKPRLKKSDASPEIIPILRGNLAPMRNKLINSNALLSCVRKGLTKKSFLCKFCRKEFDKKKDIEEHIQVHAGKKPFQCNICHRKFSRTMELSRHLKRHNAEKKYHCSFCGKAFIAYNNLKRHTYVHTGEKPYPCPHCTKSFTQAGHMKSHIKCYHKDM
ncbi:uncharacterized protein [Eucyclogobius newberryi]|uniref:uncharacterized protein n=1 Tax=Eucyclogobius newberryi TaxID=166745 RepID=UPI003B58BD4E